MNLKSESELVCSFRNSADLCGGYQSQHYERREHRLRRCPHSIRDESCKLPSRVVSLLLLSAARPCSHKNIDRLSLATSLFSGLPEMLFDAVGGGYNKQRDTAKEI